MYAGNCNSCGRCCAALIPDSSGSLMEAHCLNLVVHKQIGQEQSSHCAAYEKRWLGMPIVMATAAGIGYYSRCKMNYPTKHDAVPPECSYKWESSDRQPKWSLGYTPKMGNLITEIW